MVKNNNKKTVKRNMNSTAVATKKSEKHEIMHVQEPWFTHIKEGRKSIEGRLNKGRFANLKKNQIVIWKNGDKKIKTKIVDIFNYKTFRQMIEQEGLKHSLPGIDTVDNGVNNVYMKFYTPEKEAEFGVLAIKVEVI